MIPQPQAESHLKAHASPALNAEDFVAFSPAYRALGLLHLPWSPQGSYQQDEEVRAAAAKAFSSPAANPWETDEGRQLATLLFGTLHAPRIPAVWRLLLTLPYERGHYRRPFRDPAADPLERVPHLANLHAALQIGFRGLPLPDVARYAGYFQWQSTAMAPLLAVGLADEEAAADLRPVLDDILQGEDEIGLVSRGVIKALLLSPEAGDWELVGRLLLAAQRQEGLRQTILETLDQTRADALRYVIELILEHDLVRFSSVVRAVDVWFGYGWEATKKSTVERVLRLALGFLSEPVTVDDALRGDDSLAIHVALWSVALRDVSEAVLLTTGLLWGESRTKRLVAFYFLQQTDRSHPQIEKWLAQFFGDDLEVDCWAEQNFPREMELTDRLFTICLDYAEALPAEGKTLSGTLFDWLSTVAKPEQFYGIIVHRGSLEHRRQLAGRLVDLPISVRESLVRTLFGEGYTYYFDPKPVPPAVLADLAKEDWMRALIRRAAQDRSTSVMVTGVRFLGSLELDDADRELILSLLRRKSKDLRAALIRIVLTQPEEHLRAMTSELVAAAGVDQRLAGLEILGELHAEDRMLTYVLAQAAVYGERTKIGKNEAVLLAKLVPKEEAESTFSNGFGAVDFDKLTPLMEPMLQFGEHQGKPLFAGLIDANKIASAFDQLLDLIGQNGSFEYQGYHPNGESEIVLLENNVLFTDAAAYETPDHQKPAFLPLADVWDAWLQSAEMNDFELQFLAHAINNGRYARNHEVFADFRKLYFPTLLEEKYTQEFWWYNGSGSRAHTIIQVLFAARADHISLAAWRLDVLEDMLARLPEAYRSPITVEGLHGQSSTLFWVHHIANWIPGYNRYWSPAPDQLTEDQLKRKYALQTYLQAVSRTAVGEEPTKALRPLTKQGGVFQDLDPYLGVWLHNHEMISDDDLRWHALQHFELFRLLAGEPHAVNTARAVEIPLPQDVFPPLRDNLLQVELNRGELPTDATPFVHQLPVIPRADYLFRTLERMGDTTFARGYSYRSSQHSLSDTFSHIVKVSQPADEDAAADFVARARKLKLPRARWFEVAMYAPQWAPWIGELLNVPELELGVWWFHAHASEYMSPLKEKIVAQLTPIPKEDLQQGAIDIDWFHVAYQSIGKRDWRLLHAAAKYISDGNGHRQVKTYSAVMLGETKITETLKRIKEKRDKVYVKALGLIPFSRSKPEADALRRFNLLQEFIRESKQFGSQRQESEQTAARIGLDNLARNAGHDDPIRFGWIMEAEATYAILQQSLLAIDNVMIQLYVDDDGKADLRVTKGGKPQKTIPAKYRKHKAVLALKEHRTALRRQFSRTRQSLEQAMLTGVTFARDDFRKINLHPVVSPLLARLVLLEPESGAFGFWRADELVGLDGNAIPLGPNARLTIAHPSHLLQAVQWDLFQRYAFEQELVQPFKQIFRELYVVTADERETGTESLRYQGHQVQPRKTKALLQSRGWSVSESAGLQKVYHKQRVVATMYAAADWYSPAEVESPVIEAVVFRQRDGAVIRLEDVDPILFSEVMRDIDLVVSVAHVGGVDPETSHSTLEMRAALARESARLFGLDKVEVKQRHIVIDGKLGCYNVHLGSGMVSKGGRQLSIVAVQSQHRGRLFLPFMDDDPKSAEIISKMRMLARDEEITDPTVLGQIMG